MKPLATTAAHIKYSQFPGILTTPLKKANLSLHLPCLLFNTSCHDLKKKLQSMLRGKKNQSEETKLSSNPNSH